VSEAAKETELGDTHELLASHSEEISKKDQTLFNIQYTNIIKLYIFQVSCVDY
jgi:hypothetical protein